MFGIISAFNHGCLEETKITPTFEFITSLKKKEKKLTLALWPALRVASCADLLIKPLTL